MTCRGATMSMQWAREGPRRCVLMSETTIPTLVRPSQIAMYSGRFGIIRHTRIALGETLIERPARGAVRARGERADK